MAKRALIVKLPLQCHEMRDEAAPVNRDAVAVEGLGARTAYMKLLMRLAMVVQGGVLVVLKVAGPTISLDLHNTFIGKTRRATIARQSIVRRGEQPPPGTIA